MKNKILLILFLFIASFSNAQVELTKQHIKQGKAYLTSVFNINISSKKEGSAYKSKLSVIDSKGDKVYRGNREDIQITRTGALVTAKLTSKTPLDCINMPAGYNKLRIEQKIYLYGEEIGTFISKEKLIDMPDFVRYEDQQVAVSQIKVKNGAKNKLVKGISINCNVSFKYAPDKIRYHSEDVEVNKFTFSVHFRNKHDIQEVLYYDNEASKQIIYNKVGKQKLKFFIPYHDLALAEGKYNLELFTEFLNSAESYSFGQVKQKNVTVTQPQLYFAKIDLKSLSVVEKKYDASSALGRLFSKESSNKGKGWPDVFWTVAVGKHQKYRADMNKNSFSAHSGVVNFKIAETDPVFLSVYDFDTFNKNDFIGNTKFVHKNGDQEITYKNEKFDNVSSANIVFTKVAVPYFKDINLTSKTMEYKGVSGEMLTYNYGLSKIPHKHQVNFNPVVLKDNSLSNKLFYLNVKEHSLVAKEDSPSGEIKLFVPYFNYSAEGLIGVSAKLDNTYTTQNLFLEKEITIPEINDVKLLTSIKEDSVDGVKGLTIENEPLIPALYLKELGKQGFIYSLENNSSVSNLLTLAEPMNNKKIDYKSFNITTQVHSLFVPYYKLEKGGQELKVSLKSEIKLAGNQLKVGKDDFSAKHQVPELTEVTLKKIKAKLKFRFRKGVARYHLVIYRGKEKVYSSGMKNAKKFITYEVGDVNFISHPDDTVKFIIFKNIEGEIPTKVSEFSYLASELILNEKKKLRPGKPFAKIYVK